MTDDDFFSDGGQLLREIEADPNAPKCEACGVPYFNHLGLIGTCRQRMKAEAKLNKIFALVEAHRTEQHYRKTHADMRLWEAVLALKEDV